MRKKTKGYQQRIRNARMTICGSSTGVLLPPILQEFLKHVMTDGVVVRCLNPNLPTIAQLLLTITILRRRYYVFCGEAQKLLDNYIEELTKQACEADSSRITSFLAKQPIQVIRISALTQIIDLLPTVIQHVNIEHTIDDMFGLNTRLYNEIDQIVRQLFESQITITTTLISRAIYFHAYLLEQTLKLFDITPLETTRLKMNMTGINNLQTVACRQILMSPKIIRVG
ncbi:unnamed protein product, partial [Rotaria sp. Silwood1]